VWLWQVGVSCVTQWDALLHYILDFAAWIHHTSAVAFRIFEIFIWARKSKKKKEEGYLLMAIIIFFIDSRFIYLH
jgi:hypothetical protein